jgi:hypothetical protein
MNVIMSESNMFACDPQTIARRLVYLYSRRSAVDKLIRSLEEYAALLSATNQQLGDSERA